MNVCLFCCSLYLVRVLIVVIMGRWSEFSVSSASLTSSFHPGTILHCGVARGIVFALADKQMDMIVLHISLI